MQITDFDFALPERLIAQQPPAARDAARMLILEREPARWRDSFFSELPAEITARDVVVINNTRVFPARLLGRRAHGGGRVELLLLRPLAPGEDRVWLALARPARKLERGARALFGDGRIEAEILEVLEDGGRVVRFACEGDFDVLLDEIGRTPLPPYIKREAEDARLPTDRERYQTVYAQRRGAIAAPTAGLHFTPRVLTELRARGARIVEITLHVGYGTFAPVRARDLSAHRVAPERFEISGEAAAAINDARGRGHRIIAVGTTTVRALESSAEEDQRRVRAGAGWASLTITPGHRFHVVDALLTNFHLPRSSLLVLVASFAGRELTLAAYRHAVEAQYRFYSYGDCMFII